MNKNWDFWYYKTDKRQEFRFTYKLPTMAEIKKWWGRLFRK